jgi:hypothetical protein
MRYGFGLGNQTSHWVGGNKDAKAIAEMAHMSYLQWRIGAICFKVLQFVHK